MEWEWIVLVILLIVVVLMLRRIGASRGENTRAARLMKQYKVMTADKIAAAPDGELADAVVSRVLAEAQARRRGDTVKVLADLQSGPLAVYCVWVVCKEMAAGDYAAMMATDSKHIAALAAESFTAVGAPQCAAAFAVLTETPSEQAEQDFRTAVLAEQPLARCEEYIRDNPQEFIDEDAAE